MRTLICSLPAYSLGKEEEWYLLPSPPAAGRIFGPSSLSSRFYKHHHRRNHNRFSFRCGGNRDGLGLGSAFAENVNLPFHAAFTNAFVIVVRPKNSGKDCLPLQCSWDTITARKFNCGGLAHWTPHGGRNVGYHFLGFNYRARLKGFGQVS